MGGDAVISRLSHATSNLGPAKGRHGRIASARATPNAAWSTAAAHVLTFGCLRQYPQHMRVVDKELPWKQGDLTSKTVGGDAYSRWHEGTGRAADLVDEWRGEAHRSRSARGRACSTGNLSTAPHRRSRPGRVRRRDRRARHSSTDRIPPPTRPRAGTS